jgi:drug/metabolite transporter (DMT)-like permease
VANALPYWLFAYGEQHVPSSHAGAINGSTPLWTVIVAMLIGAEGRPSARQLLGLATGLAGTLILLTPWTALTECTPPGCTDDRDRMLGALACLAASASYGVGYAYMARHLTTRPMPPLVLATGQLVATTAWLVAVTPLAGRQAINLAPLPLASLLVLGIVGTGLAYVLNYQIINEDGPTVASTVTYLLPVVAIVLGLMFLHEPFGWHLVLGTLTVLAGVVLVRQGQHARPPGTA